MNRSRLACLFLALVTGIALNKRSHGQESSPARDPVSEILSQPEFKGASIGLLVADLQSGEVLYERDRDRLLFPASVTKLFSAAAALDAFGPDFRFETRIYAKGDFTRRSRLYGPLILRASGDPNLSGRTDASGHLVFKDVDHTYAGFSDEAAVTDTDPLAGFDEMARQIWSYGITGAEDVLIDDRLFPPAEGSGSGPQRLVPIVVNDNVVDVVVRPAPAAGGPASIEIRPATDRITVVNEVRTVERGKATTIRVTGRVPGAITVDGTIEEGRAPAVRILEIENPAAFARALLIDRLIEKGLEIRCRGDAPPSQPLPDLREYESLPVAATLASPPFSESLRVILKVSHNLHAGMLPILVSLKQGVGVLEDGMRRQEAFLRGLGVDTGSISLGGGVGGHRADCVTVRATVSLLRAMAKRPDFPVYRNALPILGVDGTLATVVPPTSPARGKVQAKTGTLVYANTMSGSWLLNSKALAGYMTTAKNREVAFALFVNNVPMKEKSGSTAVGRTLGSICEALYDMF